MQSKSLVLFGALLAAAVPVQAQKGVRSLPSDTSIAFVQRQSASTSRAAAVTSNGHSTLLLRDQHVVLQLTDAGLAHVRASLGSDGGTGQSIIRAMLGAAITEMLDRGMAYPIAKLRAARVGDGTLLLEDLEGNRVFDEVEVNGSKVMREFSPGEARRFAEAVERVLRARGR
jgi:hypothetical protein